MKILLAEDDDKLRDTFARQLERSGHEVATYRSGAQLCADVAGGLQADLVWTDLAMPDGDGFTVIRAARTYLPGVPILVVSGHGDGENVLGAFRLGADHFLPKPFDAAELYGVLKRIETIRNAHRDKVRAWHSFVRCDVALRIPTDLGVAAATASLFGKHARSFLDDAGCRGLQTAAHEILLNAIEHGCLEITHDEKSAALSEDRYTELLAARRADPRLGGRLVTARLTADAADGVTVTISDPGPGFDPGALPDPSDPDNLFLPSGRGIMMAQLQVDELRYEDGGRTAILRARAKG
jgi:DNA-binding response OmpR family regulator